MTQELKPADWPVLVRGNPFEQHAVGTTFEHAWGRTFTDADNVLFTTVTLAYNPVYLDAVAAEAAGHRSTPINPMLVFATIFGISVEDLSEIGGLFLGGQDVQYGVPVYAGDTVRAVSVVVASRESSSNPDKGIVTWSTVGTNQRDEQVISFTRTNLVAKRKESHVRSPFEGYAEDFVVGDRFRHARSKTVGDLEMGLLTPLVMNTAEGHFSEASMAGSGGRINFGGLTLSLVVGLATEDTVVQATAELGLTDIRFQAPVHAGDTVASSTEVLAKTDAGDQVDVTLRHYGTNQHGTIVCQADRRIRVERRP